MVKRKRKSKVRSGSSKRVKVGQEPLSHPTVPLLSCYYPRVSTLRQYLVDKLAGLNKKRRKRLLGYSLSTNGGPPDSKNLLLVKLLDTTLVGCPNEETSENVTGTFDADLSTFTQHVAESTGSIGPTQGAFKQSETVDFVIWSLFFRQHCQSRRPAHLLCHGFQRTTACPDGVELQIVPGLPEILSSADNPHVRSLKAHPWTALPGLLGRNAERIVSELLVECGLFIPVAEGSSNLTQISGVPMSDLPMLRPATTREACKPTAKEECQNVSQKNSRGLSEIRFVRHRILYAKPSMTSKGQPRVGLPFVHVLNRLHDNASPGQTVRVMKYIFPRQFGLHNVLDSNVDPKETAQSYKDYTLRDKEITRAEYQVSQKHPTAAKLFSSPAHLPRRLRGLAYRSTLTLRQRHARCPFHALLQHYCPTTRTGDSEMQGSFRYASPPNQVSSFCRAVIRRIIPPAFWGHGDTAARNRRRVLQCIDRFVRMRRHETFSLHDVLQSIELVEVPWVSPPSLKTGNKLSKSDNDKRRELMAELLYYVFDSLLIPLIRGNFYVTESSVHRNQLFYFRHDVWQAMSRPAFDFLKSSMLEECSPTAVKQQLAGRALGVSNVRFLPKEQGMRPIINLRRRVQRLQRGEMVLGRSINSMLTPAFAVLNHEKGKRPELLGSALFSVDEIFPRLQKFREILTRRGIVNGPLYFAKVDVKACFDTIPQDRLMALVRRVISNEHYRIRKHAMAKMVGGHEGQAPAYGAKPSWKFVTEASAIDSEAQLPSEPSFEGRSRTVHVDGMPQKPESRKAILTMLEEHVKNNVIKIGQRFYRQAKGIPQGSIVSSMLCSLIYAEMEREVLSFLSDGATLLLRLIDDFLVISTNRQVAERFMQVMHRGVPAFGIEVKPGKSLANFDVQLRDSSVVRLPDIVDFPYCGNAINTLTLNLSKDIERRRQSNIADSVTVEYSKVPGQSFYRKMMNVLKLQLQAMLLSTTYNSTETVMRNLFHTFSEVGQKFYHYVRSMPAHRWPGDVLLIRTLDDVIKLSYVLLKRRNQGSKQLSVYEGNLSAAQTRCAPGHIGNVESLPAPPLLADWMAPAELLHGDLGKLARLA